MKRYAKVLFMFRRDLRLQDNTALNQALRDSSQVLPCFIFDPRQITKHPYQSLPGLRFMLESIIELQQNLKALGSELALFSDFPVAVVNRMFELHAIEAVYVNRDYTPFSRKRDDELERLCLDLGIDFHVMADSLLLEPEHGIKKAGMPYKVFTAFYNNARRFPVALPEILETQGNFMNFDAKMNASLPEFPVLTGHESHPAGGRSHAVAILTRLVFHADYEAVRDYPYLAATSQLSAHLKFGTCSIRETYCAIAEKLGAGHPLIRQLYWRDFFTHIAFHFPHVFGKAFHGQYDTLVWDNDIHAFQRWRDGSTGFPIVDAGMRELNQTGFMHNRVRMIAASFLTKDLHISWRWGERYFARCLTDYDPCINNGNWQWAASTGCDAQPYFRIFNPWLQQKKFDPDCIYIHRWLPELREVSPEIIHRGDRRRISGDYPEPMLDHSVESKTALARYKQAAAKALSF